MTGFKGWHPSASRRLLPSRALCITIAARALGCANDSVYIEVTRGPKLAALLSLAELASDLMPASVRGCRHDNRGPQKHNHHRKDPRHN